MPQNEKISVEAPPIVLEKIFGRHKRIKQKLENSRKLRYLLLRNF